MLPQTSPIKCFLTPVHIKYGLHPVCLTIDLGWFVISKRFLTWQIGWCSINGNVWSLLFELPMNYKKLSPKDKRTINSNFTLMLTKEAIQVQQQQYRESHSREIQAYRQQHRETGREGILTKRQFCREQLRNLQQIFVEHYHLIPRSHRQPFNNVQVQKQWWKRNNRNKVQTYFWGKQHLNYAG